MAIRRSHWPITLLAGGVSVLNLLLPLVLVRILTPTEIGQYKIYFLYLALIPWLCLTGGINNGLSHWVGHDAKRIPATRASWALLLTLATAALGVGIVLNEQLREMLKWNSTTSMLLVGGVYVTLLATFFEDASIALGHILRGALFNSGFDLARNICMALAAYRYRAIEAVFWAHISVMSVKLVLGVIWGWIEGFQRPNFSAATLREVWRYAFPVSIAAALSILTGYSDQLVLTRLLRADEFGIYSIGCLTIPPLIIFEQSVNRVLIPSMSAAFAGNRSAEARGLLRNAISEMAWLMIPATVGLMVFAKPIIVMLFTDRYSAAAIFLRVYALYFVISMFPYDSVARARGDGAWILRRLGFFSALSLVLVTTFAVIFGALGALSGLLTSAFLMRITSMYSVHRALKWKWKEMFPWKEWARYFTSAAIAAIVSLLLKKPLGGEFRWFAWSAFVFIVIYMIGTLPLFLDQKRRYAATDNIK